MSEEIHVETMVYNEIMAVVTRYSQESDITLCACRGVMATCIDDMMSKHRRAMEDEIDLDDFMDGIDFDEDEDGEDW